MGRDFAVRDSYLRFMERFRSAAERAGRDSEDITVVAVSKTRTLEEIRAVVDCGARVVGENRVQEARDKFAGATRDFELHMIGHLQTNKAKLAIELFDMVQSVDSLRIAEELSKEAGKAGRKLEVLLEVNSSGEEQKYGFQPAQVADAGAEIGQLANLRVSGLMTVGPLTEDKNEIRRAFAETYKLFEQMKARASSLSVLSMGMSDDFELAIAEGSTMVRVGRAIFGPRTT
jgi:hypothetical protein